MSTNVSQPNVRRSEKDGLYITLSVIGFAVVFYITTTIAAIISGGNPHGGMGAMWQYANMKAAFGNGVQPWLLVESGPVVAPVFWIVMVIMWALIGAGIYWGYTFLAGGRIHRITQGRGKIKSPFPEEAHWATAEELKPLWSARASKSKYPMQGIVLGKKPDARGRERVLRADGETSVLVFGPTRSGKSTSIIVPNLLTHRGPVVATSTKYEIIKLTAGFRHHLGPVFIFDPKGELEELYGITSMRYSPIRGCRDADKAIETANWLVQGVRKQNSGGNNDWEHWGQKARNIMAPCLYAAAHKNLTMGDIRSWVFSYNIDKPAEIIRNEIPESDDRNKILEMVDSTAGLAAAEKASSFSTATRIMNPFWNNKVVENTSTDQLDPRRLLLENGTLYLQTPIEKPEEVAPLFVAILETILAESKKLAREYSNERIPNPLLLALDELANVCPVEGLSTIASEGAGRGVLLLSILQDYSQLERIYGDRDSRTILNNHPCKITLPGLTDPQTTDLVCKLAGQEKITQITVSKGKGSDGSRSYSPQEKPLLTGDRLQQMFKGTAILMHQGMQPSWIKQLAFFNEPDMVRKTEMPYHPGFQHVTEPEIDGEAPPVRYVRWHEQLGVAGKLLHSMINKIRR